MALQLSEADLLDQDKLASKLKTLAEIVVRKHFYASVNEREDLVSIGILKALTMIANGTFSSGKGNFATFIYTGMRNDMHNYLYHQNKFSSVDIEEMVDEGIDDNYFKEEVCYIEYGLVHAVCMKFAPSFGNNIEGLLIDRLCNSGYEIVGMRRRPVSHTVLSCNNDILLDRYGKSVRDDIIDRLVGVVLWKKHDSELDGVG